MIEDYTRRIAAALEVRGPLNVQYAVKQRQVFVIEANPRASRTVPFVAKATGVPLAKIAARTHARGHARRAPRGRSDACSPGVRRPEHVSVKEAVLPFDRFPEVDSLLGPEMRSTGEVMGIDRTFGLAFAKSQIAAGNRLPAEGAVFLSLADRDKEAGVGAARGFAELGFASGGHRGHGRVPRAPRRQRSRPGSPRSANPALGKVDAVELIASGKVQLVVNTPRGRGPAGRRRPHPPGGVGPSRALPHDRCRRPRRRRRHRRLGPPPPRGAEPPGAPRGARSKPARLFADPAP